MEQQVDENIDQEERQETSADDMNSTTEYEQVIQGRKQRKTKRPVGFKDYLFLRYKQAMCSEDKKKWQEAIHQELNILKMNNTWNLVSEVPQGCKVISSK